MEKVLEFVRALESNPTTLGFTWDVSVDRPVANLGFQPKRSASLWWKWDNTDDGLHGWHLSVFHTEILSSGYYMREHHGDGSVTHYHSEYPIEGFALEQKEKAHKIYAEYIGVMDGHSAATNAISRLIELGYIAPLYVK